MPRKVISLRLSELMLNKLDLLAVEKCYYHDSEPNRSSAIVYILEKYFSQEKSKESDESDLKTIRLIMEKYVRKKEEQEAENDRIAEMLEELRDKENVSDDDNDVSLLAVEDYYSKDSEELDEIEFKFSKKLKRQNEFF